MARTIGIVLIVLGALGFIVESFTYTQEETAVQIGEMEIKAEQQESVRIPQIASGAALVVGIGFVIYGMRSRNES